MKKLIALTLVLLMVAGCSSPSLKLGLGVVGEMSGKNASADGDGQAQADVTVCAVTLDSSNKIVGISWDVSQIRAAVTNAGAVTPGTDLRSKKEKQGDYGMLPVSQATGIGKEWFEQIDALEKWAKGKAASDVINMAVYAKDEEHTSVPDVEDLKSSVTIAVGAFLEALDKAVANAA